MKYRTRERTQDHAITDMAIEHFRAGRMLELHRELHLKVWELSPLWVEVGEECTYGPDSGGGICWEKIQDLRLQLEEACRSPVTDSTRSPETRI